MPAKRACTKSSLLTNRRAGWLSRTRVSDSLAYGRILQVGREGDSLWFNGGVVANKFGEEQAATLQHFTQYAREGT